MFRHDGRPCAALRTRFTGEWPLWENQGNPPWQRQKTLQGDSAEFDPNWVTCDRQSLKYLKNVRDIIFVSPCSRPRQTVAAFWSRSLLHSPPSLEDFCQSFSAETPESQINELDWPQTRRRPSRVLYPSGLVGNRTAIQSFDTFVTFGPLYSDRSQRKSPLSGIFRLDDAMSV